MDLAKALMALVLGFIAGIGQRIGAAAAEKWILPHLGLA